MISDIGYQIDLPEKREQDYAKLKEEFDNLVNRFCSLDSAALTVFLLYSTDTPEWNELKDNLNVNLGEEIDCKDGIRSIEDL